MAAKKTKKLTTKQEEVRQLLGANQTIEEIADLMETTPRAIKAQITRIRSAGVKVNIAAAKAPVKATRDRPKAVTIEPGSVEEHIAGELTRVSDRLIVIRETILDLDTEQETLGERLLRLEQARTALSPTEPKLAAVA